MTNPHIIMAARAAHEVNRAYCESLGDDSQKPWDEAPQWQRDSCIKGVEYLAGHPSATPAESHESWLEHKKSEGWVWGETKNEEFRTHPCIMPYDELPPEQRLKDALFQAAVRGVLGL